MNAFIRKNEKLLKFYYVVLRLSGWLLLTFGLCSSVIFIVLARNYDPWITEQMLKITSLSCFNLMFLGLLGIGLAQLIRYLFDSNYKPGLILRHGDKFIYAYVIIVLIMAIIHFVHFIQYLRVREEAHLLFLAASINYMVYFVAKALILIGIAQFLKRLMPIIEEHKSLV